MNEREIDVKLHFTDKFVLYHPVKSVKSDFASAVKKAV
jgi:hypothetical protein